MGFFACMFKNKEIPPQAYAKTKEKIVIKKSWIKTTKALFRKIHSEI
jgi:hypothetical protein